MKSYSLVLSKVLAFCFAAMVTAHKQGTCQTDLDVAIIGGGPGGLSAAIALSKLSNIDKIAVFDRSSGGSNPIGAALGLNTMCYETLEDLDKKLHDRIRELGSNPQHHILQRPSGEILFNAESMFCKTDFKWLAWYDLLIALKDFLNLENQNTSNVSIQFDSKLVDFEEDEDGAVSLYFENGDIVRAKIVIGADGYKSVIRKKTVGDGHPNYTGTMTWRGVMDRSLFNKIVKMQQFHSMKDGVNLSIVGGGKSFWVMDCGGGRIAWTGTALYEEENPHSDKSSTVVTRVLDVFKDSPSIVKTLVRSKGKIVETGVYDRDPVTSWGVSKGFKRSTLLGDAAHPMRPTLGLGSTMAFQDSKCLAKKLSGINIENTKDVKRALKSYEKERIAATTPFVLKARKVAEGAYLKDTADQMKMTLEASLKAKRKLVTK